jgi:hypothetical protein
MLRRSLLLAPAAALAQSPGVTRETFLRAPGNGVAVMAYAWYTKPKGLDMRMIEQRWSRSDTVDVAFERSSRDNGRTWSEPKKIITGEKRPNGTWRLHPRCGAILGGRYVHFWTEGVLPTDDPLEGFRQWNVFYSVNDGPPRQIIGKGNYTAANPLPGVQAGRTCVMLGDNTCIPIDAPDGRFLLPVQVSVATPDGKLYNPGGGYTWTESAVLTGAWRGNEIEWEMSDLIRGEPSYTTRGLVEPTLAWLRGGRLMMVLRGSNDVKPELPSYKWICYSDDGGRKWSTPKAWTFSNGRNFFSPSACSQLLQHSSGKVFWVGNINPTNPKGNRPRYPLVVGEVDRDSGLLMESSIRVIDTLQPGEDPLLTLSNFYAREDRQSKEIAVHVTRLFAFPGGWVGDGMLYKVR